MLITGESIYLFKRVIVVPILKPGKDPDHAHYYRSISLISCVLKILERTIKCRLDWWLQNQKLLPNNQYGFKKGFGTIDVLSSLVLDIQNNFTRNNYLGALFIDIQCAYDSIVLKILEAKLINNLKYPINFAQLIVNLFTNRCVVILEFNNQLLRPRYNSTGIPQGSVLSTILLLLIYIKLMMPSLV